MTHPPSQIRHQTSDIKKSYTISSLGDAALELSFGNIISRDVNSQIIAIAKHFSAHPFFGLTNLVPAYSSITFCFDVFLIHQSLAADAIVFDWVRQQVETALPAIRTATETISDQVAIPVCYEQELGNDLEAVSLATGISREELIHIYSSKKYYVYMMGFLPGFAYMGETSDQIAMSRKANPHRVKAGSVAIAGKQTGIYPLDSFGGWHVLGHTPVAMFDKSLQDPCFLKAGQEVSFYPMSLEAYHAFGADCFTT
ncbi:MAG: 5-oxoprolinase subunit PxpB [Chitinophagaceae bacterium]